MGVEAALMGVGIGLQGYGMLQQRAGAKAAGRAARSTAEFNNRVSVRNQKTMEVEERTIRHHGDLEMKRFMDDFEELQATAGQAYRKGGVATGTGTPLIVLRDNANEAAEEQQIRQVQFATRAGQAREAGINEKLKGQLALLHGASRGKAFDMQARAAVTSGLTQMAFSGARFAQLV